MYTQEAWLARKLRPRLGKSIQCGLENKSGGGGIYFAHAVFFAGAGLAAALGALLGKSLFCLMAGQAFIRKTRGQACVFLNPISRTAGSVRARAFGTIHVEREADDDRSNPFRLEGIPIQILKFVRTAFGGGEGAGRVGNSHACAFGANI